jgi:type I restriction enzyme S subunit
MNAERLLAHYHKIADAPDAIARLRRFILDLAVRGKLVPQDASDEPASELLKRIAREKARLVKAGEIRKPKVLPDVEEPPFDLPQNWRWTPIREVASDRGQEIPQSTFTYIDVTAIDKEAGVVADPKVLAASEAPSRARKITSKGDVIYSCVRPYLLNVAVIETDFDPQPIASTAFAILNGHGLVMPRYLWIVLRSPFMVECVEENQRGQAYPAINDADFAVLPFPLPPLAEQHRIVAKVDELIGLCDQLEAARAGREAVRDRLAAASLARLNAPDPETFQSNDRFALNALPALTTRPDQIKALRQTILNLAVRGALETSQADDQPALLDLNLIANRKKEAPLRKAKAVAPIEESEQWCPIPSGWEWVRWDQISDWITYGFTRPMPHEDAGVPIITGKNVNFGRIIFDTADRTPRRAFDALNEKDKPQIGDILITKDGSIGRTAVVEDREIFCINQSVAVLWLRSCHLNRRFLQMVLDCPQTQFALLERTAGVAIKHISIVDLGKMVFPLPPLAEQHRIVAKVDALMVLCDRLEASLTAAAAAHRRLLEALLAEALVPDEEREREAAE